ncbi:rhodanese-like domain-containing protein [Chitinophagaceae bacterium LB-8]|uniref:Rhodanese-like domain-containing protein n=1 Tax=Paraflavisolibacter caeni TaxID=2982496 RepID=A0A9X2XPF4_9BACT|nr:rhodanese-like domain-containing protein [Paraflavisolibacter caeni]MCU7550739.1 rhodanese-like domain-containing protein [Paraflavisolibacter caeni]
MKSFKFHIVLILTVLICSLTPVLSSAQHIADSSKKVNVISQKKFKRQMNKENVVILDVRTPEEYNSGNIPGSILINYKDSTFAKQVNALDKNKHYLVYCKSGNRSNKATQYMLSNGFKRVDQLENGYAKWEKSSGKSSN